MLKIGQGGRHGGGHHQGIGTQLHQIDRLGLNSDLPISSRLHHRWRLHHLWRRIAMAAIVTVWTHSLFGPARCMAVCFCSWRRRVGLTLRLIAVGSDCAAWR